MNENQRIDIILDRYFSRLCYLQLVDVGLLEKCESATEKKYGGQCAEVAACADEATLYRFAAAAVEDSTNVSAMLRPISSLRKVGAKESEYHASVAYFLLTYFQKLARPFEMYALLGEALEKRENQRLLSYEERDIVMRHTYLVATFLAAGKEDVVRQYAQKAAELLKSTREQTGEERLLAYYKVLQCNLTPKCITRLKYELLEILGSGTRGFAVNFGGPEQDFDANALIKSSFTVFSVYKMQLYQEFGQYHGFLQVYKEKFRVRLIQTELGLNKTAEAEEVVVMTPNYEFVGFMQRCIEQKAKELLDQCQKPQTKPQHRNVGKVLALILEAYETLLSFAELGDNGEADYSVIAIYAQLGVRLGYGSSAPEYCALGDAIKRVKSTISQLKEEIAHNDAALSACTAGEAEECFSSEEIGANCSVLLALADPNNYNQSQKTKLALFRPLLEPLRSHARASEVYSYISRALLDECVSERFTHLCDIAHTVCYLVYTVASGAAVLQERGPCSAAVARLFEFFRAHSSQQALKNALDRPDARIDPSYLPLLNVQIEPQELAFQQRQERCDNARYQLVAELKEELERFEASVQEHLDSHRKGLAAPNFAELNSADQAMSRILAFQPTSGAFKVSHECLGKLKRELLAGCQEYAVSMPQELVSLAYLVYSRLIDEDFLFPTEYKDFSAGAASPRLQAYESRLELLGTRCAQEALFQLSFLEAPQIALVQEDVFERLTITLELMGDLRYVLRENAQLARETLEQLEVTRQRAQRYATYVSAFEKQYPNYNPEVKAAQATAALLDIFAICDNYILYVQTGHLQPVQLSADSRLGNQQFQVIYSYFVKLQSKVMRFADCQSEDIRNHVNDVREGIMSAENDALAALFDIVQRMQTESRQYSEDAFVAVIRSFLQSSAAKAAATLTDLKAIIGKSCSIVPYGFKELLLTISESVGRVFSGAIAAMRVGNAIYETRELWDRLYPIFAQTTDLLTQKVDCPRWLLAEAKADVCALLGKFRACIADSYDSHKQEVEQQVYKLARTCKQHLHCAAKTQEQGSFASCHSRAIDDLISKISGTHKGPWESNVNDMVESFISQQNALTRRILAAGYSGTAGAEEESQAALEFRQFALQDALNVPYDIASLVECMNKAYNASESLLAALAKYQQHCAAYNAQFSQRPATATDFEQMLQIPEFEKFQAELASVLKRFLLRPEQVYQALNELRLRAQAYFAQRSENMSAAQREMQNASAALLKASPLTEFVLQKPSRAKCAESIKAQLQEAEVLNAAAKRFLSGLDEAAKNYDQFYNADDIKEAAAHFASFSAKNYGLLRQSAGEIARTLSSVLDIENRRQNEAKFAAFAKKAESNLQQLVRQLDGVFDEMTVFCGEMQCCGACTGIDEFLCRWDRAVAEIECFAPKYRSTLQESRDFKLLQLFARVLRAHARPAKPEDVDLISDFPVLALDYSRCSPVKAGVFMARPTRARNTSKYMQALIGVDDFQFERLCAELQREFGAERAEELAMSIFSEERGQFAGLRLLLQQFALLDSAKIQVAEFFTSQRQW